MHHLQLLLVLADGAVASLSRPQSVGSGDLVSPLPSARPNIDMAASNAGVSMFLIRRMVGYQSSWIDDGPSEDKTLLPPTWGLLRSTRLV